MQFHKYHALGNDYIVLDPAGFQSTLTHDKIRMICNRNFGIGSDGILFGPMETEGCDFALRIFNPDGSEAEKSGNGLRIFSRYLWDKRLVTNAPFTVLTAGGKVVCEVHQGGRSVTVDMGKVSFDSTKVPVKGPPREVLNESMNILGEDLTFSAATVGNPHCIVLCDEISSEKTNRLGPVIEKENRFPNRTNVQFMKVLDRENVQIEIWERGAGYTLASGTSSSAAAAVAHKLGLCNSHIGVHMPGGKIDITLSADFSVSLSGSVTKVCEGIIHEEMFLEKDMRES